jgi:hypothetical protein
MTLLGLIVALIIVGLLLYLVSTLPIDATIKTIIRAVVIVAVVLWLLEALGIFGSLGLNTRIGR